MLSTCRGSGRWERAGGLISTVRTPVTANDFQWEVLPCGIGYTIRRVGTPSNYISLYDALNGVVQLEPGVPEQFCIMLSGLGDECHVFVAPFSVV